jgi:hypothetical protein
MSTVLPPHASDLVEELIRFDPALAPDRDLVLRVVETMISERPEAVSRPEFRAELRGRLLAEAGIPIPKARQSAKSPAFRWKSFFFGSGFGTVFGGMVAYAFLLFVAPVSPEVTSSPILSDTSRVSSGTISLRSDESALLGDTRSGSVLEDAAVADTQKTTSTSLPSADPANSTRVSPPEHADAPILRSTDASGGSAADAVSNHARDAASETAASGGGAPAASGARESQPVAAIAPKVAPDAASEDAFSLSDIFHPSQEDALSSPIMADTKSMASMPTDPSAYTLTMSDETASGLAKLPVSERSYVTESAGVSVPKSLLSLFPASRKLSLRFMTVADESPYGLVYSLDPVGGSVFASKNDAAWLIPASASGGAVYSDTGIIAAADSIVLQFGEGALGFGSGAIAPDTATLDVVTVQYAVLANGTAVYESYGVPRAATASYDRAVGKIAGFSIPRVGGFVRTSDTFVRPDMATLEAFVRAELANRAYAATTGYRIDSVSWVFSAVQDPANPGSETLVPALRANVSSADASLSESLVMPFGK